MKKLKVQKVELSWGRQRWVGDPGRTRRQPLKLSLDSGQTRWPFWEETQEAQEVWERLRHVDFHLLWECTRMNSLEREGGIFFKDCLPDPVFYKPFPSLRDTGIEMIITKKDWTQGPDCTRSQICSASWPTPKAAPNRQCGPCFPLVIDSSSGKGLADSSQSMKPSRDWLWTDKALSMNHKQAMKQVASMEWLL